MSNKHIEQFKSLNSDELQAKLLEFSTEYQGLRFEHSVNGISNPLDLRRLRRNIARIKTLLGQKG
jgi:large subunit ribosomal protein L29